MAKKRESEREGRRVEGREIKREGEEREKERGREKTQILKAIQELYEYYVAKNISVQYYLIYY